MRIRCRRTCPVCPKTGDGSEAESPLRLLSIKCVKLHIELKPSAAALALILCTLTATLAALSALSRLDPQGYRTHVTRSTV